MKMTSEELFNEASEYLSKYDGKLTFLWSDVEQIINKYIAVIRSLQDALNEACK